MTKVRKQKRRKVYRANVNRKRLNKRLNSVGKITCKPVEKAWENHKTIKANLKQMGLVYDPNESIRKSNVKKKIKKQLLTSMSGGAWTEETIGEPILSTSSKKKDKKIPTKIHVAEELEKEAKAPRERNYELPKGQVEFITYLLDKYGHDYKAMSRDRRNYYQETWKQLRAKIRTFMGIPKQYGQYLKERGLLDRDEDDEKIAQTFVDNDDSD